MQKRTRDEVEEPKMSIRYPYATVVPLKSRGVRWSEKMQTVNTRSGEFLRSEARYI